MDWMELLQQIFELCVIPLLAVLTTYLVRAIEAKRDQIIEKTDDSRLTKYLVMLSDTITDCVEATNQTYVETLKQQGAFTAEAQKEAFERTYKAVLRVLSEDAYKYLDAVYADLDGYIREAIESQVGRSKLPIERKENDNDEEKE